MKVKNIKAFEATKYIMLGIIIGFLVTISIIIPVGASIQYTLKESEWKVVVDGQAVVDERYPVLLMDPGYNYVAAGNFREICAKAGLPFEVNAETKEIHISTTSSVAKVETKPTTPTTAPTAVPTKAPTPIPTPIPTPKPTEKPKEDKVVEVPLNKYGLPDFSKVSGSSRPPIETKDDVRSFTYNGKKFIGIIEKPGVRTLLPDEFRFRRTMVDGKLSDVIQLTGKSEKDIYISEIPYTRYASDSDFFIEEEYYRNILLPLVTD